MPTVPFPGNGGGRPDSMEGFLPFKCETCGYPWFEEAIMIMKRSMIISPSGQDEIMPTKALRCERCGWVLGSPVNEALKARVEEQRQKTEMKEGFVIGPEEKITIE